MLITVRAASWRQGPQYFSSRSALHDRCRYGSLAPKPRKSLEIKQKRDIGTAELKTVEGANSHVGIGEQRRQSILAEKTGRSSVIGGAELTHFELHRQVADLTATCAELAKQVENLTHLVQKQSSKNLLEMQACEKNFPERRKFKPTIEMVANQVTHPNQLSNDTLVALAISGDSFARRERLLREIMQVDGCSWDEAHEKLIEMDEFCEELYWVQTLPYRMGISAAVIGGIGSVLLVFSKSVAPEYAEKVAGEDLPEGVEDVSALTYNQVGTWTWSWMEPMIGTASFVLLCLQFGRAQSVKMNMHPYTEAMLRWRANRVARTYPQYDGSMVRAWAKQMPVVGWNFMPKWRRRYYTEETRHQNFRSSGIGG